MKRSLYWALLLCALLLTGCAANPDPLTPILTTDAALPALEDAAARTDQTLSTLWFRFGDEPALASEQRVIQFPPTVSYETALMATLIGGPGASSSELRGLFPPGTQVVSTHRSDRLLFVTLSRQILTAFADEPAEWAADPYWAEEVPLRRRLAMQAIIATATENCAVDSVIILLEQGHDVTDSLRLRQSYYRTGDDPNALAAPLTREEPLLLTPARTAEIILQCWQERDLARLYKYVARTGRPEEAAFLTEMAALPHLTAANLSGGSINGLQALFTLNGTYLLDGREQPLSCITLRLVRENGLWRIPMEELALRKEALP